MYTMMAAIFLKKKPMKRNGIKYSKTIIGFVGWSDYK